MKRRFSRKILILKIIIQCVCRALRIPGTVARFIILYTPVLLFWSVTFAQDLPHTYILPPYYYPASPDTAAVSGLIRQAGLLQVRSPDSSLLLLRMAFRKSVQSGYTYGAADALLSMGIVYGNEGDYRNGLRVFRQALPYSQAAGTEPVNLTASIYNNIGLVYYYLGNYSRAVYYYYHSIAEETGSRAIRDISAKGSRSLVFYYNNLSVLLLNIKQYDQAKYYLGIAAGIVKAQKLRQLEPLLLVNKGSLFVADNELDKARECFEEAIRTGRLYNHPQAVRAAGYGLGEVLLKKGSPAQAIPYLETALQNRSKSSLYYSSAMPVYLLGTAWYETKDYKKAERYLMLSLEEARAAGTLKDIMNIHDKLASVYMETGQYRDAAVHRLAYSRMKDSLLDIEQGAAIHRMEVQYRTAQKDKTLAYQQLVIQRKNTWIWTISATLALLILLILAFTRHRQRLQQKKIHILEQQKEIRSLKAVMQGEEKERMRIARELHDGIGGMLAAIKMSFSTFQRWQGLAGNSDYNDLMQMLDETGRELHQTAHNLMPDMLIRHGLAETLRMYCETINGGRRLHIDLQISGELRQLEQSFALSLYRIIQELVQNIVKHAGATHALVQVIQQDEILSILVEDNGSGFDRDAGHAGLGLKNMEYRVYVLQGTFSIQTGKDKGTLAYIEFDLEKVKRADVM